MVGSTVTLKAGKVKAKVLKELLTRFCGLFVAFVHEKQGIIKIDADGKIASTWTSSMPFTSPTRRYLTLQPWTHKHKIDTSPAPNLSINFAFGDSLILNWTAVNCWCNMSVQITLSCLRNVEPHRINGISGTRAWTIVLDLQRPYLFICG